MREATAHRDSYLNLNAEILSVYPTTIFYRWHDTISSDGQYPAMAGVYTLAGREARNTGYVLAIEEDTVNLLESNGIDTTMSSLVGWTVNVLDTAGVNSDGSAIMSTDSPTDASYYFIRLYSASDTANEINITTDTEPFMSSLGTCSLSFYYRTNTTNAAGKVNVQANNVSPTISILNQDEDLSDEWVRSEITFTAGIGLTNQNITISINFSGYVDITSLQLEAKTFATSWHDSGSPRGNGYLQLADEATYPAFFPDDQIAISTWIKYKNYTNNISQTIIGCATSGYSLGKTPGGDIEFSVNLFDGSFARANFSQDLLPLNEWHMITGLFLDNKISIYLDNQLKDISAANNLIYYKDDTVNSVASKQLYIGIDPNLISADTITRVLFFNPLNFADKVRVVCFNPGSPIFHESSDPQEVIDFNFQVSVSTDTFAIPIGEPTTTSNQLWVFSNGLLQKEGGGDDYTVLNPTGVPTPFDIVFNSNRNIGDVVQAYVIEDATGVSVARTDWAATASQTQFTISYTNDGTHLLVFCNGLCMTLDDDYTETTGTYFDFVSGRAVGDKITVFVFGGGDSFDAQNFQSTEGQANFQLNPIYQVDDSLIVFCNGILNTTYQDYTLSTQDLLNGYVRNTRIEPGRVNILRSFVRFIVARESGDTLDVVHLNPSDAVPGAFDYSFNVYTETDTFTVEAGTPGTPDDHVLVICNGVLQQKTTDYTVTPGASETIVQFTSNRLIGDNIKVIFVNEDTSTWHRTDTSVGSPQSAFNIGTYTNNSEHLLVFTNGFMNVEGGGRDYVETSSTVITFNTDRLAGDVVTVFKIDTPAVAEHDIYDVSTTTFSFDFATEYKYYVYNIVNSSGLIQTGEVDYSFTASGEITAINVNSQVVQTWYENDLLYDWKYRKVIA